MTRDLKADQEICAHFNKLVKQGVYEKGSLVSHESVREILKFALVANEGWPYALNRLADMQERAEKAEALVREGAGVSANA